MASGWILNFVFGGLMVVFWQRARRRSTEQLFEISHDHHHQVLSVPAEHPKGGSWGAFTGWIAAHGLKADDDDPDPAGAPSKTRKTKSSGAKGRGKDGAGAHGKDGP